MSIHVLREVRLIDEVTDATDGRGEDDVEEPSLRVKERLRWVSDSHSRIMRDSLVYLSPLRISDTILKKSIPS